MNRTAIYEGAILELAGRLCRDGLGEGKFDPGVLLTIQGLIAARDDQPAASRACLSCAACLRPTDLQVRIDLAEAFGREGRWGRALAAFLWALRLAPARADILLGIAEALRRQGHGRTALAVGHLVRHSPPDSLEDRVALGDLFRSLARYGDALTIYDACLALADASPMLCGRIGAAYLGLARYLQALEWFERGVTGDETCAELHAGKGQALKGLGAGEAAMNALEVALALEPVTAEAACALAEVYEATGFAGEAGGAWFCAGRAFAVGHRFGDAADAYRKSNAHGFERARTLVRLGTLEKVFGTPQLAIDHFRSALAISPLNCTAHIGIGWAAQLADDPSLGWDEFSWYSRSEVVNRRGFEQPLWDGRPLGTRTILLWAGDDYGLGDTLHLARYIDSVKTPECRVIVECQPSLVRLIETMKGSDEVIPRGAPLPSFDVHAPLMYVPVVHRAVRRPIPANVPYIRMDRDLVRRWRSRAQLRGFKAVGMSWGGHRGRADAPVRFMPLVAFAPLADVRNVRFISLQLGIQEDELKDPSLPRKLARAVNSPDNIVDTAAMMENLDLIITVDTMIAHLAGALAKPVWMLLPAMRDWKWHEHERSSWYPTMRVFRQTRAGCWDDVILRVRAALVDFSM